jgi:hypothetical protein
MADAGGKVLGPDNDAGHVDNQPNWLHEINNNQMYEKADLLDALVNQIFPCIVCSSHNNIDDLATWIPIFLWKLGSTTWEVFDAGFEEMYLELEWDGDEGLGNVWGLFYRCPGAESIQCIQVTQMEEDPSLRNVMLRKELAVSLGNAFSVCAAKTTIPQAPGDAIAMAAMVSSHITSSIPRITTISVTQTVDKHNAKLQAALDKHQDDILCLLQTGNYSGKPIISPKMLHKIWVANMTTMTKTNLLTARLGGKSLTMCKLKELNSYAKHKAMERYKAEVAAQNAINHEPPSNTDDN